MRTPIGRSLILAVGALLAACGANVKYDAAQDVRTFLVAVREGDAGTFEAHIDRPALREAVASELREALEREGAGGVAAALGTGAVEGAADRLISPEAFRLAAEQGGLNRTPSAAEIATQLRVVQPGRVCLPAGSGGGCALSFAQRDGVWKLVAIDFQGVRASGGPAAGLPMQRAWPEG